jgi:hypothetical protein
MRRLVKAITSFIVLLVVVGVHAQSRVIDQSWQFSPDPKAQFTAFTVDGRASWRSARASLSWNSQYDDLRDYAGVGWYRVKVVLPRFGSTANGWANMKAATRRSRSN